MSEAAARVHLIKFRRESLRGNFVFPGTDYFDDIEVDGEKVGLIVYGVSPLLDQVYISDFEIFTDYHRLDSPKPHGGASGCNIRCH